MHLACLVSFLREIGSTAEAAFAAFDVAPSGSRRDVGVPGPLRQIATGRARPAFDVSLPRVSRPVVEHDTRHAYPVVIINWVRCLGPPVPFSFPDSRDLLEVLVGTS